MPALTAEEVGRSTVKRVVAPSALVTAAPAPAIGLAARLRDIDCAGVVRRAVALSSLDPGRLGVARFLMLAVRGSLHRLRLVLRRPGRTGFRPRRLHVVGL